MEGEQQHDERPGRRHDGKMARKESPCASMFVGPTGMNCLQAT